MKGRAWSEEGGRNPTERKNSFKEGTASSVPDRVEIKKSRGMADKEKSM